VTSDLPLAAPARTPDRPHLSAAWLIGHQATLADLAKDGINAPKLKRLREHFGEKTATTLAEISSQHARARLKFGPGDWMTTAKSVAQATERHVARYKAGLFGSQAVFDLCGGVGGDAMELARRGPVISIDADPQISALATANLLLDRIAWLHETAAATPADSTDPSPPFTPPQVAVVTADVTRYPIPAGVAVHIDPDRRPEESRNPATPSCRPAAESVRVVAPERYQPSLGEVRQLLENRPAWIVKLAPAADLETAPDANAWLSTSHRQWISFDGSVREQCLLGGSTQTLAGVTAGGRSAVRLGREGIRYRFVIDAATAADLPALDRSVAIAAAPGDFIFDPDPAIRAAGLSACFATRHGWACLGGPAGFLCGDELPMQTGWGQAFRTLWSGPADLRRIRKFLRSDQLEIGTVKVRGTSHDPSTLLRQLRSKRASQKVRTANSGPPRADATLGEQRRHEHDLTLLLGRHSQGVYAVIGQPVPGPESR